MIGPSDPETAALFETAPRFDGAVYDPALDDDRLRRQLGRVWHLMRGVVLSAGEAGR